MPDALIQSDLSTVIQRATIPGKQNPLGYAQVTATGSAFSLPSIPANASYAMIQAEAQNLRWRDDGTAPNATVGMLLPAGAELEYNGNLAKLQLIAATAGAICDIAYYG